jgi:hypothetical protein
MEPQNPIPDLPLNEFWPVGFPATSLWQRTVRKVNWGYRRSFRRAWVNARPAADGDPVYFGSTVDSWHCGADADLLFNSSKPSIDILTQYSDLSVEITDQSISGARIFRWDWAGLRFELRALIAGEYSFDVLAVSRGQPPTSHYIEEHCLRLRDTLQSSKQRNRFNCIHTLWRFLFGIALFLPMLATVFVVVAVVGTGLGLGSGTGLLMFVAIVAGCFGAGLWFGRRNRDYLSKHWSRVFYQGDHDGTVRRALASIGIHLPPAPNL